MTAVMKYTVKLWGLMTDMKLIWKPSGLLAHKKKKKNCEAMRVAD